MTPATYTFPDHVAGDTVSSRRFTVTRTVGGMTSPENLTGVSIACWFARGETTGQVERQMSNGNGITVVNAAGGVFDLDAFTAFDTVGVYRFDIQFTYPDGRKRTYVAGTLRIRPEVSRP
jgi:hypothetical protein